MLGFLGGIRFAPVGGAVIRIIFRTIDIGVQLDPSVKADLLDTVGVAPRLSVESFHGTPE
jgi:hypothetical protein